MSDGVKSDVPNDGGVKRAGRVRICKECRFTTTDVREFSNHCLHAHAEETLEDKTLIRINSSRRKSSTAVSSTTDEQKIAKEQTINDKSKIIEEKDKYFEVNDSNLENKTVEQIGLVIFDRIQYPEIDAQMATEQKISDELLNSLALAPWKSLNSDQNKQLEHKPTATKIEHLQRPPLQKIVLEKQNGYIEETLLVNKDDKQDEEPCLVIADDNDNSENGDNLDISVSELPVRSGNIQNRTYMCSSCDFNTTNAKTYLHHERDNHHSDLIIYECNICDYATKYKQKLPRHRKLHFNGKDGVNDSDVDSSLTAQELKEMKESSGLKDCNSSINDHINGDDDIDDEGDLEEDDDEEMIALTSAPGIVAPEGAPVEKKKRIRQEVDPLKYYEVVDDVGVKYACSKCGNVYKWRKSLNKHWKEKHFGEVPDLTKPPVTLQNFTLFSRYKSKYGGQPPPPAAPNVVYGAAAASTTPQIKNRSTPTNNKKEDEHMLTSLTSVVVMPRQIGPFIAGTSSNMFNNQSTPLTGQLSQRNKTPENQHDARQINDSFQNRNEQNRLIEKANQMFQHRHQKQSQHNQQTEPLDFSKPLDFSRKQEIKSEPSWADTNSESDSLQDMPLSMANSQIAAAMKQGDLHGDVDNSILRCTKCNFVAKTLMDYSSHMSLHLNKRAFKCAECQAHFNGVEDLNKHFMDCHSEKIQEHKEAIQKIPHGLQQTYHLLKMPLDSISGLSSQELMSNEPKQLKCSMCNFVAKWPAELQKHAVSHSEERPFVCMVCGSTYKWKWDLVKHFEKSHSSLPNPYKRREGGGVMAVNSSSNSPASSPLDAMSKTALAVLDTGISMSGGYMLDEDMPPVKKRHYSETENQDSDDFYRELLERQIRHRHEMSQAGETPPSMKIPILPRLSNTDPLWKAGIDFNTDRELDRKFENQTSKKNVHEALKQRLHLGKPLEEEMTPQKDNGKGVKNGSDVLLPYKCSVCDYRARWPSEISQHMKNHSNEKPFHCPRCSYKSKWKWDVVKHLRRCGGGTVHDVIDTTKIKKMAPPNVMVMPHGNMQQQQQMSHLNSQTHNSNQSVFPGSQRASSLSPSMVKNLELKKSLTPNFSLAVGGQDHPEALEQMHSSVIENHGQTNGHKQPVFHSLVNQGMHHCLECPFIGSSPAELRRHSVLHSEKKPFSCSMCGYSTRWKCDLKKHVKTYGHFSSNISVDSGDDGDNSNEQLTEMEDDSDEENKSTLYMCPQCPYNSYKKNAYDLHLRIHGNIMDGLSPSNEASKYKCSKCNYHGNDLSSFLQHKRSHVSGVMHSRMNDSQDNPHTSSPIPNEVSSRTLQLKHRRKPVKQFRCEKCPFICFKMASLDNHDAMHIPRGTDTYLCMFCDYNVFSKSLLLQHMRLHPEYNPAECSEADIQVTVTELKEMEELEEREIATEESKSLSEVEENNNIDGYESGLENAESAIDFSKVSLPFGGRTSTPSNSTEDSMKSIITNNNNTLVTNNNEKSSSCGLNLPCEWCSATFPNVVTLYQHSQSLHPMQLKAQEAGDIAARQAPSKGSQLEQIVRERQRDYQVYHQFMARQQPQIQQQIMMHAKSQESPRNYVPLAPKQQVSPHLQQQLPAPVSLLVSNGVSDEMNTLGHEQLSPNQLAALRARKSASQQKKARWFQCTKCAFTAPNAVTYLRHIERHGSNSKHTCLFCDYSIDRLNLLYQHMKGTHGSKWHGTTEEKMNVSGHSEDSNNNVIDTPNMSDENSNSDEQNASFNSSHNDSLEGQVEVHSLSEVGALSEYNARGIKPALVLLEETSWKGITIQVCSLDGKKHYKCPKCLYISNSASTTAVHSHQHGQNCNFKCHQCDFSVDNVIQMQHHKEHIHIKEAIFILMNSTPTSSVLIDDYLPEINNNGEEPVIFNEKRTAQEIKSTTQFTCPKCPYQTAEKEKFQIHLERHSYNGKYECQLCDYTVDQYGYLKHHAKLHNTKYMSIVGTNPNDEIEPSTDLSYEDHEFSNRTARRSVSDGSHKFHETSGRIRFRCSCCPYFTFKKSQILGHRYNHITQGPYSCQMCTFSTKLTQELEEHVQFHHSSQTHQEQYLDITLDPFGDMYKAFETIPYESTMDIDIGKPEEFAKSTNECMDEFEEMDGIEDVEDDVEMAMMEEELRDAGVENGPDRNVNVDGAFISELQFRTCKCKECPYSSNSHSEFRKHSLLHGANNKFKCDYCSYSLERVNLISQHRKLHFQEKDFESTPLMSKLINKDHVDFEVTLAKFGNEIAYPPSENNSKISEENLESYMVNKCHGDKIRHSCNKCPFQCHALKRFKCHVQMHGLTRQYKCDYCDWSTNRLNLMYQHRKVHCGEKEFNISPGDITFLNRDFVLEHEKNGDGMVGTAMMEYQDSPFLKEDLKVYQSPKKNALGEKIHYCKLCPFTTENVNVYSYHKKLHCIQAKYSCSECSFSINNINSLTQHIRLHNKEHEMIRSTITEGGTRLKCPKCPYSSPNKNLLVNHTSMHSSGRKYSCTQCDFSTDKQAMLNFHVKVHDGNYSDKDSLDEMELLMKQVPNVIGPQLYLSSANMNDMDSDSSQSVDSDHKCDKCPFSTVSIDELASHVQQHVIHGKNSCLYCTYSCSKEDDLLKHVQVHFLSNTVDKDTLMVLKGHTYSNKKNISKNSGNSEMGKDETDKKSTENIGEPDSTVSEPLKVESSNNEKLTEEISDQKKESEKTKVYVCQFCEREFDCKRMMLQHEKQHLVGSKF